MSHSPQQYKYPSSAKSRLQLDAHHYKFPFDFCLVVDCECFLVPNIDDDNGSDNYKNDKVKSSTMLINAHILSGFCIYYVTEHDHYHTEPYTYSGQELLGRFFEHIFDKFKTTSQILSCEMPMGPLTYTKRMDFNATTVCHNCKMNFTQTNAKTRHHNHVSGTYLFPTCCNCNLALKSQRR